VSSILQALKKIESESPEKSEIRFRQQEIDAQKIIHKRITDKLRLKKQFFIIFATIILAAGGGLVLGRKPWEKVPLPATKTEHTKPLSRIGKKKSPSVIKPREKEPVSIKKTKIKVSKSLSRNKKKIAGQDLIHEDNHTKRRAEKSGQYSPHCRYKRSGASGRRICRKGFGNPYRQE